VCDKPCAINHKYDIASIFSLTQMARYDWKNVDQKQSIFLFGVEVKGKGRSAGRGCVTLYQSVHATVFTALAQTFGKRQARVYLRLFTAGN
jgi:hypothetical protein